MEVEYQSERFAKENCETASEVDPVDVFKIEGFAGDEIENLGRERMIFGALRSNRT